MYRIETFFCLNNLGCVGEHALLGQRRGSQCRWHPSGESRGLHIKMYLSHEVKFSHCFVFLFVATFCRDTTCRTGRVTGTASTSFQLREIPQSPNFEILRTGTTVQWVSWRRNTRIKNELKIGFSYRYMLIYQHRTADKNNQI